MGLAVTRRRLKGVMRGLTRSSGILRLLRAQKTALACLIALAFLVGSLIPSLQGRGASEPSASALLDLQAALGYFPEALLASLCQHGGDDGSSLPDHSGDLPCKKSCPLCQALQHFGHALSEIHSASIPAFGLKAASPAPNRSALFSRPTASGQRRPRAPPTVS